MELRQLRYFVRIIETGGMGSAAQDLDISFSSKSTDVPSGKRACYPSAAAHLARQPTPTNAGLAFYSRAQLSPCVMPTTRFSPPEGKRTFPVM